MACRSGDPEQTTSTENQNSAVRLDFVDFCSIRAEKLKSQKSQA
jgi:hypothetical protein